jgi:glycosyltransferase involved in cell wall biosynthesis
VSRIRWAGVLPPDQVVRLWTELDVLVLPSLASSLWSESVAHVLIEAMAHEVAVVGSDSGIIPEVVGDAGIVVPAGDAAALAQALRRVAQPNEREPLIRAGRARAMQRFSNDAIAERTIAFWREVVK